MAFYIFRQNTITRHEPMAIDNVLESINPLEWISGNTMPAPTSDNKPLQLDLCLEGRLKSGIVDGILTLYHYRLYEVINEFSVKNIQAFPVILRDPKTGETNTNYRLVNIVGLLDCIDMDKSKVKPWPSGRGYDFCSIVIDEKRVQDFSIFRLKEDPTKVVISEALKQHIESKKMTAGIKFISTEEHSDW